MTDLLGMVDYHFAVFRRSKESSNSRNDITIPRQKMSGLESV
jgi:hypothetical protein